MKSSVGERIARQGWMLSESVEQQGKRIDRAIRREKAKAWDEGYGKHAREFKTVIKTANPYRGRAKR